MQKRLLIYSVAVFLLASCINEQQQSGANIKVGDRLPEFQVQMSDGIIVSNLTLQGTPALIVFFNTGCPDCQRELPIVQQLYLQMSNNEVQVVCISRAQTETEVAAYWFENQFTMPFSAQPDRRVYELFAQTRIPRLYAVNAEGIIIAMWDDRDMPSVEDIKAAF